MAVMDKQRWQRASAHLDRMLDLPPDERAACLAALRKESADTAADVQGMLEQHRRLTAEGFLETQAAMPPAEPALEGVAIGAYTLISPIGSGGMGSVWLAARNDGRFEGQAAVKLLNAALIGKAGEERFRQEGTILARLTHPNIARLIDAGVSSTGQPYLVLEHVHGRDIATYCDAGRLTVEARLRLFLDVLAAVAHAHANLIVHRDLKPSNVLVNADGQVKLLDFGIAKLIEDASDELARTELTRDDSAAMTPKYAAPEQVAGGLITTATDVYSLGVVLFELLSGQHPTAGAAKSPAEFVKTLVESEPLRLGAALDRVTAFEARARIAAIRGTTQERLRRTLRRDLDTILAKALKKNPTERYVSVAAFADDVRRYLAHQPIAARPDAFSYRTVKFARRHRGVLAASAATFLVLVGLIGFYTAQLAAERDRATLEATKASRVSELLTSLLTASDPYRTPGATEPTVRNLLDAGAERIAGELGDQPEVQAELLTVMGRTYERIGVLAKALALHEQALAIGRRSLGEHPRVAQSLNDLGVLNRVGGKAAAAEPLLRESLAMRRRLLGDGHKDVAVTLVELARVLEDQGRSKDAEPLAREALAIRLAVFGHEHRETATSKNEVGMILMQQGDLAGAEPMFRENVATSGRLLGRQHPNTVAGMGNLAQVLTSKGDLREAEAMLREALEGKRKAFGNRHWEYATTLSNLSIALEEQGRLAEAQAMLEEAVGIGRSTLGDDHPRTLIYGTNLARVQIKRGDAAATEPLLRHILQVRERLSQSGNWRNGQAQSLLAASLIAQRRYAEAEPLLLAAARTLKPIAGQQGREYAAMRERFAALYLATERPLQAAAFR
jgi:serine/threonine protein kinase